MRRYAIRTRPRAEIIDDLLDTPMLPEITVYEPEPAAIDTGLMDRHGNAIVSYDERRAIGFTAKWT